MYRYCTVPEGDAFRSLTLDALRKGQAVAVLIARSRVRAD
jgi:hypothetical protein